MLYVVVLRAGTAHLCAVLLTTARLVFVRRRCRLQPYRMHGLARVMQCSAVVAALVCLLVELFQLNARIAADPTPLIQGDIAPFEWAGAFPTHYSVHGHGSDVVL